MWYCETSWWSCGQRRDVQVCVTQRNREKYFTFITDGAYVCMHGCLLGSTGLCVCVEEGPVHVSGLYIMDEFAAVSRTGRAGLISKRLERCYLYRELEGLQEEQQEEEEEERGPLGYLPAPEQEEFIYYFLCLWLMDGIVRLLTHSLKVK